MSPAGGPTPSALVAVLEEARARGFLGPGPVAPHIEHARGFALAIATVPTASGPRGRRILDLGAGGGIPGLVLALETPSDRVLLLDASARRCAWLREAVERLQLSDRVEVHHGRAEELARTPARRGAVDVVVARAFGAPAPTAEIGGAFLVVGGLLVVSEPPPDRARDRPVRWPAGSLAELGLAVAGTVELAGRGYVVMQRVAAVPDRVPRRTGIPTKRPLW